MVSRVSVDQMIASLEGQVETLARSARAASDPTSLYSGEGRGLLVQLARLRAVIEELRRL